ncbi:MAG: hypothetical protein EBS07_01455 [Sphingobacteriia bacterium]|nr:hypothetical protein [Sphingobacteriia bacterium]
MQFLLKWVWIWLLPIKVWAQYQPYPSPLMPPKTNSEIEAAQIIHDLAHVWACQHRLLDPPKVRDSVFQIVTAWHSKIKDDPKVSQYLATEPYTSLGIDLTLDLNQDAKPDAVNQSDAHWNLNSKDGQPNHAVFSLPQTGIIFKINHLKVPSSDSLWVSFIFEADSGVSVTLMAQGGNSFFVKDFISHHPDPFWIHTFIPGDKTGKGISLSLSSVSGKKADVTISEFNLRVPEKFSLLFEELDTCKVETFGSLNVNPIQHRYPLGSEVKVEILEGPSWVNTDSKGYLYGRATCPPGFYPLRAKYLHPNGYSKEWQTLLWVQANTKNPEPLVSNIPTIADTILKSAPLSIKEKNNPTSRRNRKQKNRIETSPEPEITNVSALFVKESNPSQLIRYALKAEGYVSLFILNKQGENVKTIFQYQKYVKGKYTIHWDGSNDAGESLSKGDYQCKIDFLPSDGSAPYSEVCPVLKVF